MRSDTVILSRIVLYDTCYALTSVKTYFWLHIFPQNTEPLQDPDPVHWDFGS